MKQKLLDNLKHLPSTIAGGAVIVGGLLQQPAVQQAAAADPHIAALVGKVGLIAGGLYMIFGAGAPAKAQ